MTRSIRRTAAVLCLAAAGTLAAAGPVQAASRDGSCNDKEFCYYYGSNNTGSVSDFGGSLTSLSNYGATLPTCYVFKGTGSGKGQCIKNNAASVWNRTSGTIRVYYNSGYGGTYQSIAAGYRGNLNTALKNNNASHRAAVAYGQPNDNPHPSAVSRAPNATARTQFVDDEIARLTGERDCWVGDYRSYQPATSNHNTGNALDCTISNAIGTHPTAAQKEQGWKLAYWLERYAPRLDVRYVIWQGKIWSVARSSEGWRPYSGGSGVTGGHYDHVHVSIQNPYGD